MSCVQGNTGLWGGSAGGVSIAFPSNNIAGNTIIVAEAAEAFSSVVSVTDSQGNTYVPVANQGGTSNFRGGIWAAFNCRAGANTVTVNDNGGDGCALILEYSDSLNAVDATGGNNSGTSSVGVSATLGHSGDMFLAIGIAQTASATFTLSSPAGWTIRPSVTSGGVVLALWDSIGPSAGSASQTITASGGHTVGILAGLYFATPPARGNIDSDQFQVAARHGGQAKVQMSDGTGAVGNLPAYNADGSITDSGVSSTGVGSGSVTSVAVTVPSDFAVSGSPITGAGTIAITGGVTKSAVQQEAYTYAADTGSANAYAVTLSPAPSLVAGSVVQFKAANANTTASTLAVNGGSAIAIKKNGNSTALSAGDISAGQIITALYDGTVWQILVPGSGAVTSLTTTGTSGAATLSGGVLNIPQYSGGGGGPIGKANFCMTGGAITKLTKSGVISAITYNSTGKYTVTLSPAQTNFTLSLFATDTGSGVCTYIPGSTVDFSASTSSFQVFVLTANVGAFINPDQVTVTIF